MDLLLPYIFYLDHNYGPITTLYIWALTIIIMDLLLPYNCGHTLIIIMGLLLLYTFGHSPGS